MQTDQKVKIGNKIKTPFTWVENDLIRSKSLSAEEIGVYYTFISLSDNDGLIFNTLKELCTYGKCGKDKLNRIIDSLIKKKLLLKIRLNKKSNFFRVIFPDENYETVKNNFQKYANRTNI
jgi:hypothetical protein